jgi:copper chaperone
MIEIAVQDMTCGHCVATITKAVKETDAAARCEIDLEAKRVRIEAARPAKDFVAAIAGAGYTPVLAAPGA